jgi:hypothetical protein
VASNAKSAAQTLALLGRDDSYDVQRAVAGNQATPADVLTELAMHYDEKTARRPQKGPRCPPLTFWQKLRIHFRGG